MRLQERFSLLLLNEVTGENDGQLGCRMLIVCFTNFPCQKGIPAAWNSMKSAWSDSEEYLWVRRHKDLL